MTMHQRQGIRYVHSCLWGMVTVLSITISVTGTAQMSWSNSFEIGDVIPNTGGDFTSPKVVGTDAGLFVFYEGGAHLTEIDPDTGEVSECLVSDGETNLCAFVSRGGIRQSVVSNGETILFLYETPDDGFEAIHTQLFDAVTQLPIGTAENLNCTPGQIESAAQRGGDYLVLCPNRYPENAPRGFRINGRDGSLQDPFDGFFLPLINTYSDGTAIAGGSDAFLYVTDELVNGYEREFWGTLIYSEHNLSTMEPFLIGRTTQYVDNIWLVAADNSFVLFWSVRLPENDGQELYATLVNPKSSAAVTPQLIYISDHSSPTRISVVEQGNTVWLAIVSSNFQTIEVIPMDISDTVTPLVKDPIALTSGGKIGNISIGTAADTVVAVWEDKVDATTHLFSSRLTVDGATNSTGVLTAAGPNSQTAPTVTPCGDDGFFTLWTDSRFGVDGFPSTIAGIYTTTTGPYYTEDLLIAASRRQLKLLSAAPLSNGCAVAWHGILSNNVPSPTVLTYIDPKTGMLTHLPDISTGYTEPVRPKMVNLAAASNLLVGFFDTSRSLIAVNLTDLDHPVFAPEPFYTFLGDIGSVEVFQSATLGNSVLLLWRIEYICEYDICGPHFNDYFLQLFDLSEGEAPLARGVPVNLESIFDYQVSTAAVATLNGSFIFLHHQGNVLRLFKVSNTTPVAVSEPVEIATIEPIVGKMSPVTLDDRILYPYQEKLPDYFVSLPPLRIASIDLTLTFNRDQNMLGDNVVEYTAASTGDRAFVVAGNETHGTLRLVGQGVTENAGTHLVPVTIDIQPQSAKAVEVDWEDPETVDTDTTFESKDTGFESEDTSGQEGESSDGVPNATKVFPSGHSGSCACMTVNRVQGFSLMEIAKLFIWF